MRALVPAGTLKDLVNRSRAIIPSSPSLIAYTGVLLQVEGSTLTATASDGDSTVVVSAQVDSPQSGRILLSPKPLGAFLASVPSTTTLTLSVDGSDMTVAGDGLNPYVFRGLAATFPVAAPSAAPAVSVDFSRFADALSAVRPTVAKDTSTVQMVSFGDTLTLHATDGFRLARVSVPGAGFGEFTGLLPLPVLDRVAKAGTFEVVPDLTSRQMTFRGADMTVSSRLLAVPFPAVETVLDGAPPAVTGFAASPALSALSRLSAVAEQGSVRLTFTGSSMRLSAASTDVGSGQEEVTLLRAVPSEFSVHLRAAFLVDAVDVLAGGDVQVAYSGSLHPVFFSGSAKLPTTHVIMPVRS